MDCTDATVPTFYFLPKFIARLLFVYYSFLALSLPLSLSLSLFQLLIVTNVIFIGKSESNRKLISTVVIPRRAIVDMNLSLGMKTADQFATNPYAEKRAIQSESDRPMAQYTRYVHTCAGVLEPPSFRN